MHLMDRIVQMGSDIVVRETDGTILKLPGTSQIAKEIEGISLRYTLNDSVVALLSSTLLGNAEFVSKSRAIIRLPAQRFWVEWPEPEDGKPSGKRRRIGVLVEGDDDLQSGRMQIAWSEDTDTTLAQAGISFDLRTVEGKQGFWRNMRDTTNVCPHILSLLRSCDVELAPAWQDYFMKRGPHAIGNLMEDICRTVWREPLLIFAFALFLQSKGSPLLSRPADIARLNAARQKRGKSHMLDRLDVLVHAGATLDSRHPPSGGGCRSLHFVRGHFVHRRNTVFWRSPHLRGDADRGIVTKRYLRLVN